MTNLRMTISSWAHARAKVGLLVLVAGTLLYGGPSLVEARPDESNRKHPDPITIAVTPLMPVAGEPQAWLSKGLGDLLIKDLAEVKSFTMVTREEMQIFTREAKLADSALFGKEKALRLGRVAKVDSVIYGHYSVLANGISISIFLVHLDTQKVVQKEKISGDLTDLRSLVRTLVLRLVDHRGIKLSEREKSNIQYQATDSTSATKHFYQAINLYDLGQYADAFGEFYAAVRQDPAYREARL